MKKTKKILQSTAALLALAVSTTFAADNVIPFGNGTWVYDGQYTTTGKKLPNKAGLFLPQLTQFNQTAAHPFNEVFAYGGDIEMYCAGSGESKLSTPCKPGSLLITYFPQGYASQHAYLTVPNVKQHIVDIDGRVDNKLIGEYDYLDHLNTMTKEQAQQFADIVAKNICTDDSVDGVQFDVEPFSFTGNGGTYKGPGQKYFYTEIAKDFSGYYGNADNPEGINPVTTGPLHCVDKAHPNGRTFSVFTFSNEVTPDVVNTFNHHGNGYIVDSLYDLGTKPGGQLNTVKEFKALIKTEIAAMQSKGVPYQFAIPGAASAHEFETGPSTGVGAGNQLEYVKAAIEAINPSVLQANDPNFKGIDVWSWNQAMWWRGGQFTPATPPANVQDYLKGNM